MTPKIAEVAALAVGRGGDDQADDEAVKAEGLCENQDQDHAD
eukprot:CAMPEP_0195004372 /NCGR_PEP_ID=MMETSP0326_2-20130528/4437_1 /TAXON_ID=2866 ORGANISM="Crypthecodinium cohnii, Strain Seligo" /NCGR_SAMPLE_ID=MMETSP0326_2 /ASSEMBLY_ACC=CAM_ASM_000348 /LENGTH=41 /DNA_ID= /DNA_START= /DNA_END= /DNA_ORIENTATION=